MLERFKVPEGDELPPSVRLSLFNADAILLYDMEIRYASRNDFGAVADLAPGTYSLEAEAPDGRRVTFAFEVTLQGAPTDYQEHYAELR